MHPICKASIASFRILESYFSYDFRFSSGWQKTIAILSCSVELFLVALFIVMSLFSAPFFFITVDCLCTFILKMNYVIHVMQLFMYAVQC